MKGILVLLLVATVYSLVCDPDYYLYLNGLYSYANLKCQNSGPFNAGDKCVDDIETYFALGFSMEYPFCDALDTSGGGYEYTMLSDYPSQHLTSLGEIYYTYTGITPSTTAVPELLDNHSFGIVQEDDTTHLLPLNKNRAIPDDGIDNVSWVYSTKYVIDYWMGQYEVYNDDAFVGADDGFKIDANYIYHCIANDVSERKYGMDISEIFVRINARGVGEGYVLGSPCPTYAPLTDKRFFHVKKIRDENRGGLIELVDFNYIPIVPISFDLHALKFMKTMASATTQSVILKSPQPTMYGVLNGFDNSPADPYWDVITNILPAMSIKLKIYMSALTTDSNTNGIAAFAHGVKLNLGGQADSHGTVITPDPGLPEVPLVILNRNICDDKSTGELDLSQLQFPDGVQGFYIPKIGANGAECGHITNIIFPEGDDFICAWEPLAICADLIDILFDHCPHIVVDLANDCGGTVSTNLGKQYTEAEPNNVLKTVYYHPYAYATHTTMKFDHCSKLYRVQANYNTNLEENLFSALTEIEFNNCPLLSRLDFSGRKAFNSVTHFHVVNDDTVIGTSTTVECPTENGFVPGFYMHGNNPITAQSNSSRVTFMSLKTVEIKYQPCFQAIQFTGGNLGSKYGLVSLTPENYIAIEHVGSSVTGYGNVTISAPYSFYSYNLFVEDVRPAVAFELIGTNLFSTGKESKLYLQNLPNLKTIYVNGNRVFADDGQMIKWENLPKLDTIIVEGSNAFQNILQLTMRNIGQQTPVGSTLYWALFSNYNFWCGYGSVLTLENIARDVEFYMPNVFSAGTEPFSELRELYGTTAATSNICGEIEVLMVPGRDIHCE